MAKDRAGIIDTFIKTRAEELRDGVVIDKSAYDDYNVKRGLRNSDGTGVTVGITRIGNVRGYYIENGEPIPAEGELTYRGIDVAELVRGFTADERPGFEETAYLLLFGQLPDARSLEEFRAILAEYRLLPNKFFEDMILAAPSKNIMNKLSRSVLALYSYDDEPETFGRTIEDELDKAIRLIARCPVIVANAFAAKRHYFDNDGLHLRRSRAELGTAENFLNLIRQDGSYTAAEARLLDLCFVLHAEHGGGNNSAFACRVLSSAGTDIYSAIAAAVGSLKGARHGGANERVADMLSMVASDVADWTSEDEVREYLHRVLRKEAGLGDGLIYGMGHAIYTLSDPRAVMLKAMARELAVEKGMREEFDLIESVERLTPSVFQEAGRGSKPLCANVDMYSGFVYRMLGIPRELYTPLFAVARMAGWCAHRVEEAWGNGKIMRPAYKAITKETAYTPLGAR
ncbi:MAG: citrate synthase [Oscillospiraceae bacterium]|jgi:citrate synthase|nr:citrate synthase [Oscillospiraceae bacterium]